MRQTFLSNTPKIFVDSVDMEQFKLCLTERPKIPTPKRKQTVQDSQFSDRGSYRTSTGWEDIDIKVTFNYLELVEDTGQSFRMAFSAIRHHLLNATHIEFNDEVNVSYRVKNVEISDASNEFIEYGEFDVTFICSPFGYLLEDEGQNAYLFNTTGVGALTSFDTYNDGFYTAYPKMIFKLTSPYSGAKPKIKMKEIGDDGVFVDNIEWTFEISGTIPATSDLIIDSERALIYWEKNNGAITPVTTEVIMKTFPEMKPLTNYRIQLNTGNQDTRFNFELERNRVI